VQSTPSGSLDTQHRGKYPYENTIIKTLAVSAAAILATGCVSTSTFNEHVASADAAIKAAQQDAAAAKAAAQAAASSASSAASGRHLGAEHRQPGAAGCPRAPRPACDATNEKIDRAFKKSMGK